MTPQMRDGLLFLGVIALAAFLLSPLSPARVKSAGGGGDITWRQGYPTARERLCPPEDIEGGPMTAPHTLYRRPPRCGHNVSCLTEQGWNWIIDPPSEQPL